MKCIQCNKTLTDRQITGFRNRFLAAAKKGLEYTGPFCSRKCAAQDRSRRVHGEWLIKFEELKRGNEG